MLHDIVRAVLLAEVKQFVTTVSPVKRQVPVGSTSEQRDEDVGNDKLVQEIRNALMMPKGVVEHARILMLGAGVDPEKEGQSTYVPGKGRITTSALKLAAEELRKLDQHMSGFIVRSFGHMRGETGEGAVKLPAAARAGSLDAYDMLIRALEAGLSSTVDTQLSRAQGGKLHMGQLAKIEDEDLVEVVVDDMIEILLAPTSDSTRLEFDRVEEEMQKLVDSVKKVVEAEMVATAKEYVDRDEKYEVDKKAKLVAKLGGVFSRQIASASSRAARQERDRGARVPDATVRKLIDNVKGLLDLFLDKVVSNSDVPVEEYGQAFAAIVCESCGLKDDYRLPPSMERVVIKPMLPPEVDVGIVNFVREVHRELLESIGRTKQLRMAYLVITDSDDLYDEDGRPTPTYTFDHPHPAYAG